jgi:pimeloyl-ACP methyl ester carboxylesterase
MPMSKVKLRTGITMAYERSGSGPPVILIPGTSLGKEAWALQRAALESAFDIIAVDPRGAGETDAPKDRGAYSARVMAQDVAELIDALDLGRAHVAGMSLGSAIVQELVLLAPEKVISLQLHQTWGRSDAWFRQAFVAPMIHFVECSQRRLAFKFGQALTMSPQYLETQGPPSVAAMVERCLIKNPRLAPDEGFIGQLCADAIRDALDRLPQIGRPTLVTACELDANTPLRYGLEVHGRMRGAQLKIFGGPRSSHLAMWEMAEEFNLAMCDFLRAIR